MEEEKQIEQLKREREEYLAGWQRARADFLNYRREELERLQELVKFANEEVLLNLLPVVDNLERAEKEINESQKESQVFKGCLQVLLQLREFLKSHGVEPVAAVGEKFSPEFHEAVGEAEGIGQEPGTVAEEIEKGYTLHGRLLRPAKVKIYK